MDEARSKIIAVAREWIKTPFHDGARLKGIGVDCAQFVAAVYEESGIIPQVETPHYSPQFFLHEKQERLIAHVVRYGGHEIEESAVGPGDLALYKYGHCYAHAAIIVEWPKQIIHAHKMSRAVLPSRPFDGDLNGRPIKFFSLW